MFENYSTVKRILRPAGKLEMKLFELIRIIVSPWVDGSPLLGGDFGGFAEYF